MSNPFVTNDPLVRSYKFLVPGVKPRVEFKGGILDPDDYGPDAETVRMVPWASDPTAQIIHDCFTRDGAPHELAPRSVLRRVIG